MDESFVWDIYAQVKENPHKLVDTLVHVVAGTMKGAMTAFELDIAPQTVYHYHSVTCHGPCLH